MALLFAFPGYEDLCLTLNQTLNYTQGNVTLRHFPDGESFVQLHSDVKDQDVFVLCGLERADTKAMALLFFSNIAKELGAKSITLIAPYLGYMRQDKRFQDGEAITSEIFAHFLSKTVDRLITIDPHLHRHKTLSNLYTIPAVALQAAPNIASWIQKHTKNPLLIGPDGESEQWISKITKRLKAPFVILNKIRHGDRDVEVSAPDLSAYKNHTPLLVDDIISTGMTMIETITHLKAAEMKSPLCIAIHAVFAQEAHDRLKSAGAEKIITCNTIPHFSNGIDISNLITDEILRIPKPL